MANAPRISRTTAQAAATAIATLCDGGKLRIYGTTQPLTPDTADVAAIATASFAGTTMTVSAHTQGSFTVGMPVTFSGVTGAPIITAIGTALYGTRPGTYTLSVSQSTLGGRTVTGLSPMLAELTFSSPAFATPGTVAGQLAANSFTGMTGLLNGKATWFRAFTSPGNAAIMDGVVGLVNGADLNISNINIVSGTAFTVGGFNITQARN